jgi:mercuric reductase
MSRTELEIHGMTCEDCAVHVRAALERAGAREIGIDWQRGEASIAAGGPSQTRMNEALAGTRYHVERVRQPAPANGEELERGGRDYRLVVLGSGGGAFAAAIRARDLGHSVVLVEHGTIGGTCVNVGCIPSKSLLVSSLRHDGQPDALGESVRAARGQTSGPAV